jgi:hypothetical protein
MAKLYDFAIAHGTTLDRLAVFHGLRVELLENADLGRQALPLDVASRIAASLGLQPAEVVSCVSRVTTASGEDAERPYPPEFGDAFRGVRLARTLSVLVP